MSRQKKVPAERQNASSSEAAETTDLSHSRPEGRSGSHRAPRSNEQLPLASDREESFVVPLVEEKLSVDKTWVEAGAVELRKTVETRTESVPVDLKHEEVEVQRVAVNRPLGPEEKANPRQEGDVWIIPIIEEEIVVTKRQIIREEVRVRKKQVLSHQQATGTVMREDLAVDTAGNVSAVDDQAARHAEGG